MLTWKKTRWLLFFVLAMAGFIYAYRIELSIHVISLASYLRSEKIHSNRPVVWGTGSWQGSEPRPPNIIIIMADDMGFNDVSTYGGGHIATPHIDQLAHEGILFANGYAGSATCAPSRAMLMTGRYSTRFGFEFTPTPDAMMPIIQMLTAHDPNPRPYIFETHQPSTLSFHDKGLPGSEITIAEELKKSDYHTIHIGKWHLGRNQESSPNAQGYDEDLMMRSGLYLPAHSPDVVNAKLPGPIDNVLWRILRYAVGFNNGPAFEPEGYLTDYFTQEAVKAIAANKNRPFFMSLNHWGIHNPLQALKSDYEAVGDRFNSHRERVYAAMIRAVDRSVGKILEALKAEGIDQNTLIIFTSDNGGADYIGIPHINKPYRGWKATFFEGGTHVPLMMRWPAQLPKGIVYPHPVVQMDFLPTIVSLLSRKPSHPIIDGVNLMPYLTEKKAGKPHDTLIWRSGDYQAIMADGWKMHKSAHKPYIRLYNLLKDPFEHQNIAYNHPEIVKKMLHILDKHNKQQAPSLWKSRVQMPVWIDKSSTDTININDDYIYWPN